MQLTLPAIHPPVALSSRGAAILQTLMYFDIFRHPLTTDEARNNCQWLGCTLSEATAALEELQQLGLADELCGFWFLPGRAEIVPLRKEREERALRFMKRARLFSSLIASFPFVRGVFISGSLSKGTMDRNGDIDYFIITEPGRLWIARTFLVLFKKIFLLNSKKYFCVNYFIDTKQLSIPDRNLFVATEINFIRPMNNSALYKSFMEANRWVELFYPNSTARVPEKISQERNSWMKRAAEKALGGNVGEWMDEKFLRMTLKRWKKKFPYIAEQDFEVDFRSRKHVSKHHPQGFQRKVSVELEKRRVALVENAGVTIPAMRWEWTTETELSRS